LNNSILPLPIEVVAPDLKLLEILKDSFNQFKILAITDQPESIDLNLDLPMPGLLFRTSGSTGNPKLIYFSYQNLLQAAQRTIDFYHLHSNDNIIGALPLHHVGGLMSFIRSHLLDSSFVWLEPSRVQELLPKTEGDVISLVPAQLARIIETPLALARAQKLKLIIIGGEAPAHSLIRKALSLNLKISVSYGASETGGQICAHSPGSPLNLKSSGFPMAPIKIHQLENSTLVSGPGLANAIIQDSKVTPLFEEVLLQDRIQFDGLQGIKILGRNDRLFKSAGHFIDPDQLLLKIKDELKLEEAYIYPLPHEKWGHLICLLYKRKTNLKEKDKMKLKKKLNRYEFPSHFIELPDFGSSFKRSKSQIEEILHLNGLL